MAVVTKPIRIRHLDSLDDPRHLAELSEVLIDCVDGGASVSFMHPLSRASAEAFWRDVGASLGRAERTLLVAQDESDRVVGTVQVVPASPENQPHRADVSKMLVHRRARRQGVGAALMHAAEQSAWRSGKTLLVLDTVTGGDGERLYQRLGWQRCGVIPDYALLPRGGLVATTVYFKKLGQ